MREVETRWPRRAPITYFREERDLRLRQAKQATTQALLREKRAIR